MRVASWDIMPIEIRMGELSDSFGAGIGAWCRLAELDEEEDEDEDEEEEGEGVGDFRYESSSSSV